MEENYEAEAKDWKEEVGGGGVAVIVLVVVAVIVVLVALEVTTATAVAVDKQEPIWIKYLRFIMAAWRTYLLLGRAVWYMVPSFQRNLLGTEDQNHDIANWVDEIKK